MQPILVSYEAPFRSNLQINTGPIGAMTLTGPQRLVAFNFFERELKNKKKKHLFYAKAF